MYVEKPAGYGFLLTPPQPEESSGPYGVKLDLTRLLLSLLLIPLDILIVGDDILQFDPMIGFRGRLLVAASIFSSRRPDSGVQFCGL